MLNKIADVLEANAQLLATAETMDNGKPIRETAGADIPLTIDHFRYFASVIRAEEGSVAEISNDMYAYHIPEPLGVVAQIIPWNFPLLMAAWKVAPALAAGNCVVLKPAEQTPASIMVMMDLIGDLIPPGVLNVVSGFGLEAGKPLASSKRVKKVAFTGETTTGRLIMQYASQNLIPITLELGGKSPNIFFEDIMLEDDAYLSKCFEGFAMFAFNQGEVCTCPSRALVQESIYEKFMEKALERVKNIKQDNPLISDTALGAQASVEQMEKIKSYLDLGKKEGAEVLAGGDIANLNSGLEKGNYIQPTVFKGHNKMRIFQEEIFGPVVSVTTFKDKAEALEIAKKTAESMITGDPKSNETDIGPLVSETQFDKVQALLESGLKSGAKLVTGGPGKPTGLEKGYYVKPTVFGNVSNNMEIAREEIFGPVLSVVRVKNFDEALKLVNDHEFGNGVSIFTRDGDTSRTFSNKAKIGMMGSKSTCPSQQA